MRCCLFPFVVFEFQIILSLNGVSWVAAEELLSAADSSI